MCALYVCDIHLVCIDRGGSYIYCSEWKGKLCIGVVDTNMAVYQMLFTDLAGATSHDVGPPVTSGKSQEEEISSLSTCLSCERGGYIHIGRCEYVVCIGRCECVVCIGRCECVVCIGRCECVVYIGRCECVVYIGGCECACGVHWEV